MLRHHKWVRNGWILLILVAITCFIFSPETFSAQQLASYIGEHHKTALLFYLVISLVRGLFLLPSTPFVLCGLLLFPQQPLLILIISMVGIMFTAFLLYSFAEKLGFRAYLLDRHPHKMEIWENRLQQPFAFWLVLVWSFFPFVPTDLICYVAGTVKMKKLYYFSGVFVGELILVAIYVFAGQSLWEFIFS